MPAGNVRLEAESVGSAGFEGLRDGSAFDAVVRAGGDFPVWVGDVERLDSFRMVPLDRFVDLRPLLLGSWVRVLLALLLLGEERLRALLRLDEFGFDPALPGARGNEFVLVFGSFVL